MAFIKSAVHLIVRENLAYKYQDPVLLMGVPEVYANYGELRLWFQREAQQPFGLRKERAQITRNPTGLDYGWVDARSFLEAFGLSKTFSVDIPGCEHAPDLVHDLNEPLPPQLSDRFGLVLDPGTLEHVFDVRCCLSNVVKALLVGGTVIHLVPIYSYNGGYYSVNPNVLHDFYRANGFTNLKAYIIMWDRYWPYTGKCRCYRYSEPLFDIRHALSDRDQCRYSPELLFFATKSRSMDGIRVPIQHGPGPSPSFHQDESKMTRIFSAKVRDFLGGFLPTSAIRHLDAVLWRRRMLRKTRAQSFWI